MAAQARNLEHERGEVKVYEKLWIIPDWGTIQQNEDSLTAQTFHFETGETRRVKTKWEIGFNLNPSRKTAGVYWKLVEVTGCQDKKLQTTVSTSLLLPDSRAIKNQIEEMTFEVNQIHEFANWTPYDLSESAWNSSVNFFGELTVKLNLTLLEPAAPTAELKMEEFHKSSIGKLVADFGTLLNDESTADLKILTSDEKELFAHKAILKARCPVFESMFRSRMSEGQTGIVDVQDITGKTMGIFLHYFYSGKLLPSWKDEDTVMEFTYAAGKYQLTDILELLDNVLGSWSKEDSSQTNLLLLDLAAKLGLKNAEKELLGRITAKYG